MVRTKWKCKFTLCYPQSMTKRKKWTDFTCFLFKKYIFMTVSSYIRLYKVKSSTGRISLWISDRLFSRRPTFLYSLGPKILVLLAYKFINLFINIFKSHWSEAYICSKWSQTETLVKQWKTWVISTETNTLWWSGGVITCWSVLTDWNANQAVN